MRRGRGGGWGGQAGPAVWEGGREARELPPCGLCWLLFWPFGAAWRAGWLVRNFLALWGCGLHAPG